MAAAITCVAGYLPEDKLTNADLEKMVDTSDEWIRTRTGIEERRILKRPQQGHVRHGRRGCQVPLCQVGPRPHGH